MMPSFLAIGHVVKDAAPEGFRLGGSAAYAALTAVRMGLEAAIVTRTGKDLDMALELSGVQLHCIPSPETTTFENIYTSEGRSQYLRGRAGVITVGDLPLQWLACPLVLLCPVAQELDYRFAQAFYQSTVVVAPQGWVRSWREDGRVEHVPWRGDEVLPHVQAAVLSQGEVAEPSLLDYWKHLVPVLIITQGKYGARLHHRDKWHHIRAFPAREIEPTGAGDVFAAAYLIRYSETQDPVEAALFASCAASFCVEEIGLEGVPTREQVETRQ